MQLTPPNPELRFYRPEMQTHLPLHDRRMDIQVYITRISTRGLDDIPDIDSTTSNTAMDDSTVHGRSANDELVLRRIYEPYDINFLDIFRMAERSLDYSESPDHSLCDDDSQHKVLKVDSLYPYNPMMRLRAEYDNNQQLCKPRVHLIHRLIQKARYTSLSFIDKYERLDVKLSRHDTIYIKATQPTILGLKEQLTKLKDDIDIIMTSTTSLYFRLRKQWTMKDFENKIPYSPRNHIFNRQIERPNWRMRRPSNQEERSNSRTRRAQVTKEARESNQAAAPMTHRECRRRIHSREEPIRAPIDPNLTAHYEHVTLTELLQTYQRTTDLQPTMIYTGQMTIIFDNKDNEIDFRTR